MGFAQDLLDEIELEEKGFVYSKLEDSWTIDFTELGVENELHLAILQEQSGRLSDLSAQQLIDSV